MISPPAPVARADMVDQLDLKSDDFTKADVTRQDVLAAIAQAGKNGTADFSGRRLNGLDLSGLDLRRLKLQAARINGANFSGSDLEGVVLDQAWGLKSDFSNADLKGASLCRCNNECASRDKAHGALQGLEILIVGRGAAPALDPPLGMLFSPAGKVRLRII